MRVVIKGESMETPFIELKNVAKVYKRDLHEIRPLDNLNLTINRGEFLALVGPSGSGKSTLLNIIAGMDQPTSGEVCFNGSDISGMNKSEMARWRNRHIGFVFQSFNLIPVLTARENVELPLLLTKLSGKQREEHINVALKVVGLTDRGNHYPRQLSGGQEQRVAIARAIVSDPTVIVADEPTGDLDAASAEEVLTLLQELNRSFDKTIIMVTHDTRAIRYATTCKRLDKGRMLEDARSWQEATI
jgi:putative ABC transport system ATP-binding protein